MSTIERIDNEIEDAIKGLTLELGSMFTTPQRKTQVADDIAKLRASMSPQCNCDKH